MRVATALVGMVALAIAWAAPAAAESAQVGSATASTVGNWIKPTGCSKLPVEYANLPPATYARLDVLDAVTRTSIGSEGIYSDQPRSGRLNVQVCDLNLENTDSILLSLDLTGVGAADSAPFAWTNLSRCVNRKTYNITLVQGSTCPKGTVKR